MEDSLLESFYFNINVLFFEYGFGLFFVSIVNVDFFGLEVILECIEIYKCFVIIRDGIFI